VRGVGGVGGVAGGYARRVGNVCMIYDLGQRLWIYV